MRETLAILARKETLRQFSRQGVSGLGREGEACALTEHAQNNTLTAARQISPPGSISVVSTHSTDLGGKPCSTEKYSREEAMSSGHDNDTSFLLPCADSILHFSFWGGMICLLEKQTQHIHARHTICNGFTNIGACGQRANIRVRSHFSLPPIPPMGLCGWPPCPGFRGLLTCSVRGKARLRRICTSLPVPLSFSPQLSGSSRLVPGLRGLCQ